MEDFFVFFVYYFFVLFIFLLPLYILFRLFFRAKRIYKLQLDAKRAINRESKKIP